MLGEAGTTVYFTGRSVRGRPATAGWPETIEETAEMVTGAGGRGIAVRTDQTVVSEVENLFARIREEQNQLDILANDVWGGDELTEWSTPFWKLSTEKELWMLEQAVHSHIITSRVCVPIMAKRNAGLIIILRNRRPCFVGRAVAGLAADPNIAAKSGDCSPVGDCLRSTIKPTWIRQTRLWEFLACQGAGSSRPGRYAKRVKPIRSAAMLH